MQNIIFNNGVEIPAVGLGVFRTPSGDETVNSVRWALEAGYRHIDTAMIYGNEESVAEGIRQSGVAREDIFVTTKLWNEDIRQGRAREAFEESLRRLDTDYVDLYLIHWPAEGYEKAWGVMEDLYEEGRIRAIGVSNFKQHHLETLAKTARITPAANQIESNPQFNNQEMVDWCLTRNIAVEVWSPLGGSKDNPVLGKPELVELAEAHEVSVAQLLIRWHLQRGTIVLPKSTHKERIEQNLDVFGFELAADEMAAIAALDTGVRIGADPDTFDF